MPEHDNGYSREVFLQACGAGNIVTSSLNLDKAEHAMHTEILRQTIQSGAIFLLDQAVYTEEKEHLRQSVTSIGKQAFDARNYQGFYAFMTYFGDTSDEDAAALATLFVNPPGDGEGHFEPVFMSFAVENRGFNLLACGQFSKDGLHLTSFSDGNNADEVAQLICGTAMHSYFQAMGLYASGAVEASRAEVPEAS